MALKIVHPAGEKLLGEPKIKSGITQGRNSVEVFTKAVCKYESGLKIKTTELHNPKTGKTTRRERILAEPVRTRRSSTRRTKDDFTATASASEQRESTTYVPAPRPEHPIIVDVAPRVVAPNSQVVSAAPAPAPAGQARPTSENVIVVETRLDGPKNAKGPQIVGQIIVEEVEEEEEPIRRAPQPETVFDRSSNSRRRGPQEPERDTQTAGLTTGKNHRLDARHGSRSHRAHPPSTSEERAPLRHGKPVRADDKTIPDIRSVRRYQLEPHDAPPGSASETPGGVPERVRTPYSGGAGGGRAGERTVDDSPPLGVENISPDSETMKSAPTPSKKTVRFASDENENENGPAKPAEASRTKTKKTVRFALKDLRGDALPKAAYVESVSDAGEPPYPGNKGRR